ncbi:MAG: hypothetical protein A3D65_03285 [Candidatus Lloydbacteria bacterium RIFCSPHIGHO2_02_FULL_50_13]|uniref:Glycosyl transferase family 1 domain-containing protein n=1 Tax=Candidatus Lloydbacteria bacterium RIFCSPHIGHO2_02_FULL_50_13 TaxID=1798661 RepID=A0A1G2D582_9BACT|nr:MAG: hypothetical protein A3D65_03285 [Candidatus Lloydbacteria bacterium RIFCSPHIGHO2_02_FULL_50_13]
MKKILVVNYEFPPIGGGGGRVSFEIAKRLKDDVNIDVLTSHYKQKNIYPEKIDGVRFFTVPSYRVSINQTGLWGVLSFLFFGAFLFRKLVKDNTYDLIHYYFSVPTGALSFLQPKDIPYIVSLNGGDVPGYAPREMPLLAQMTKFLNKKIVKNARFVTAVSSDLGNFAQKVLDFTDCKIIHNGVAKDLCISEEEFEKNKALKLKRKTLSIICVSRLAYFKRIDILIRAMANMDDIELKIVGEGSQRRELEKLVSDLRLGDKISFLGFIHNSEIGGHLMGADVFVLPSIADSFGIVFLEAMAKGLPVIGARAGGVVDIIKDGESGFLVKPLSVGELTIAISRLRDDRDLSLRLGKTGLAIVKNNFLWESKANEYLDLYKEAMAQ